MSPYFESLASTLPLKEAVRQTQLSIDVMNFFGMKPSGYWLVERIWEPGDFILFTMELRKLGISKAAIDDHLFYKMDEEEIESFGFISTSFSEKNLRGYFILDDELKEKDPFYILPANRDYRQARPYWLSEIPRKGAINNHNANYLPTDQLIARTDFRGYITLPFGAYKEMTWWAHTTGKQVRLNTLKTKVDTLKRNLLFYNALAEELDDKIFPDEKIQLYDKLSNTETKKYQILLDALEKSNRLPYLQEKFPGFFLTKKEEEELKKLEKGIPWKNFWRKYLESYKYHRLWLFLYQRTIEHVDNEQLKELILNLLGKATVNCGSWHGVFGGRYLANLRHDMMWGIAAAAAVCLYALEEKNLFTNGNVLMDDQFDLMGALADELQEVGIKIEKKKKIPDIIVMTCRMMVVISLKNGGTLFDWIYYDTGNPLSVINTINLTSEPYHDDAGKMVS